MAAEERVCPHCGRIVHGHGNARFCGEPCRRAWERRQRRAEGGTSVRVCHDCGRRTTDYRCPACRAAFRQRHGVAEDTDCEEDFLYV